METKTHKEWTNYETAAVAEWIKNDQANRERWDELAQESLKLSSPPEEHRTDAVAYLADSLKFSLGRSVPQRLAEVYRNLIFAALGKVDWAQIADDYLGVVTVLQSNDGIWTGTVSGQHADLKFPLGRIVSTPGALESIDCLDMMNALDRHHRGDWGDCCDEDWETNDQALVEGSRLLSVYLSEKGDTFWIITEADRSATTILLPSEY